jgi:hypothetical protein
MLWSFCHSPGVGNQQVVEFGELSEVPTGGMQVMCHNFTLALQISEEVLTCDTGPDLNSVKDLLEKWTDLVITIPGARYNSPETLLQSDKYKNGITEMLLPAPTILNSSTDERIAHLAAITTAFPFFIASCEEFSATHQRLKGGKGS